MRLRWSGSSWVWHSASGAALLSYYSPLLTGLLTPSALVLRTLPVVAIIPMIARLFGYGQNMLIGVAVFISFFPAFVLIGSGLRDAPRGLHDLFAVLGAGRVGAPAATRTAVRSPECAGRAALLRRQLHPRRGPGQYLIGSDGLGYQLANARAYYQPDRAWGVAVVTTALAVAIFLNIDGSSVGDSSAGDESSSERSSRQHATPARFACSMFPGARAAACCVAWRSRPAPWPSAADSTGVASAPSPDSPATQRAAAVDQERRVRGYWLADDGGMYASEGVAPTFLSGGPDILVETVLAGGGADVGITGGFGSVVDANAAGTDFVIFASTYQTAPRGLLSLASNPVRTPQDLVGKRIGAQQGARSIIDAIFAVNGLPAGQ